MPLEWLAHSQGIEVTGVGRERRRKRGRGWKREGESERQRRRGRGIEVTGEGRERRRKVREGGWKNEGESEREGRRGRGSRSGSGKGTHTCCLAHQDGSKIFPKVIDDHIFHHGQQLCVELYSEWSFRYINWLAGVLRSVGYLEMLMLIYSLLRFCN